jgi:hypothetical protein
MATTGNSPSPPSPDSNAGGTHPKGEAESDPQAVAQPPATDAGLAAPATPRSIDYSEWFTHANTNEHARTVTYRGHTAWASGSHVVSVEDKTKFLQDWDLERDVKSLLSINEGRRRH